MNQRNAHASTTSRFHIDDEWEKADIKKYLHINWTHILKCVFLSCTYPGHREVDAVKKRELDSNAKILFSFSKCRHANDG